MNRLTFVLTDDFAVASQLAGRAGRQETGLALLRGAGYLFGMGHGRYGGAVAMQNQTVEWLTYYYLDNYYLKTLVETGIAGLTAYLFLIASTLAALFRAVLRARGSAVRPQICAILAALTGVLAHCLFENIFEVPYMSSCFWGLAGLACASVGVKESMKN
jgi:O-antigen ligase